MGTQLPSLNGTHPQFSAHVCCRQKAGWIKTPLGMEVGLGPGDIVLDGDPAPLPSGPCPVAKRLPISATAEHLLFFYFFQDFCLFFGYVRQMKLAIPVSNWALDNTVYRIVSHRIFDVGAGQLSKLRARNYVSGDAATLMVIFMPVAIDTCILMTKNRLLTTARFFASIMRYPAKQHVLR